MYSPYTWIAIMPPSVTHPKKATNITLSADVLSDAKALGINISQACDQFLRKLVRSEQERRWQADNAEFIAAYNADVAREGLPLDAWRSF
jgi:antitoxin CcdA